MKERIIQLVHFLMTSPQFTSVVGERLFPLIADEGVKGIYAIYVIGSVPVSKDGGREYNAGLQVYFPQNKFTEMVEFGDTLTDLLNSKSEYDVGPVDMDYSDRAKSPYMTLPFNID